MKKEVNSFEYKKILLETLCVFDEFCKKNDIKYFLIGGTLLGAIRHKGFIPWDDDIDVGMPRNDYCKLVKLFKDSDKFKLLDCFKDNDYYLPFAKFYNTDAELKENIPTKKVIGPYIDIFIFDFIKNKNDKKLIRFFNKSSFLNELIALKYASVKKGRHFFKNFLILLSHCIYPFSLNTISKIKNKKISKLISLDETEDFGTLYGMYGLKDICRYEDFRKLINVDFEGKKFFAPAGYHNYLSSIYGDYMKLPPEDQRSSHHGFDVFWRL